MKKIITYLIMACFITVSSGCITKEQGSTLAGGAIGAILGSAIGSTTGSSEAKFLAVTAGALTGALVGNEIGQHMDPDEHNMHSSAAYDALETYPSGTSADWDNPDNGNYGSITPLNTYEDTNNQYCREYQQEVFIGGSLEKAYGTACRQADGSWHIVK